MKNDNSTNPYLRIFSVDSILKGLSLYCTLIIASVVIIALNLLALCFLIYNGILPPVEQWNVNTAEFILCNIIFVCITEAEIWHFGILIENLMVRHKIIDRLAIPVSNNLNFLSAFYLFIESFGLLFLWLICCIINSFFWRAVLLCCLTFPTLISFPHFGNMSRMKND